MELWFDEIYGLAPGARLRMKVSRILDSVTTPYQKIDVFETPQFGKVLVIDGIIMLTESDEFCYHEMIAHPALVSHPNPERVLVIGGGDGGAVRQIVKHKSVKSVKLCDIDSAVTEISRKHFPDIAAGLSNPCVELFHEDGADFIKRHQDEFDAVIVDSTDPIGPGESLFTEGFLQGLKGVIRKGGICIQQAESFFYHPQLLTGLFQFVPRYFKKYGYYWTAIPTYPSGMIGFSFLSDEIDPYSVEPDALRIPGGLRYYSAKMHKAAFCLPAFAEALIGLKRS